MGGSLVKHNNATRVHEVGVLGSIRGALGDANG